MNKGTLYIGGLSLAILVTLVCWAKVSHNGPALRAMASVTGIFSKSAAWNTPVAADETARHVTKSTVSTWHKTDLSLDPSAPFSAGVSETKISLGGHKYAFRANQLGSFPQVPIKAKETATVAVHFDQGQPGDPIQVQVRDGGGLAGNKMGQMQALDQNLAVNFTFTAGVQNGIYRVTLMQGGNVQTVNFWVGPPLALRSVAQAN